MTASMSLITEPRFRPRVLLPALAALLMFAGALPAAARSNDLLKPTELRKLLQKVEKRLEKIEDAMEDGESGRAGTLLRLADEDLVRFTAGSGLESLLEMMARARQAVGEPEMKGAREALQAIREGLDPLSDYIVRRDAEVACHAARRAVETSDLDAYTGALHDLDSALLAPVLMARITAARDAIAGGRTAMVGRNMEAGRSQAESARKAIEGLRFAAAVSQAVFNLEITSEFIADGYGVAARDHLRGGERALRTAVAVAQGDLQADLQRADEVVKGILDRLSSPLPEDPGALEGALSIVKTIRTGQQ